MKMGSRVAQILDLLTGATIQALFLERGTLANIVEECSYWLSYQLCHLHASDLLNFVHLDDYINLFFIKVSEGVRVCVRARECT